MLLAALCLRLDIPRRGLLIPLPEEIQTCGCHQKGVTQLFESDGKNAIHDRVEHEAGGGRGLLDPTDTALLLLDHQARLLSANPSLEDDDSSVSHRHA